MFSRRYVEQFVTFRRGEAAPLLWSAAYFFCLLFGYYLLRPVREAMGIARSADDLPWLMTGTLVAMLAVSPLFAALVSRVPRRRFIPITYEFFASNLLIFSLLLWITPGDQRLWLGYAFYIWLSVYNLFAISIFWAVMSDIFAKEQGKRLFGLIGVGGTLGAICGSTVVRALSDGPVLGIEVGPHHLMLCSVGFIQLAVLCVWRLSALPGMSATSRREPGPGALEGLRLLARSRYLGLIAAYMAVFAILSTYIYLEQGRLVSEAAATPEERRAIFATMDVGTNILTLIVQLFITGTLISRLGVPIALVIVPVLTLVGFTWLSFSPSLSVLMVFVVLRRGLHYAVDRPAREVLYTIVTPDARYKSKTFIDTFIYRAGDMAGAWSSIGFQAMAVPLTAIGGVFAVQWLVVSLLLGREHQSAASGRPEGTGAIDAEQPPPAADDPA